MYPSIVNEHPEQTWRHIKRGIIKASVSDIDEIGYDKCVEVLKYILSLLIKYEKLYYGDRYDKTFYWNDFGAMSSLFNSVANGKVNDCLAKLKREVENGYSIKELEDIVPKDNDEKAEAFDEDIDVNEIYKASDLKNANYSDCDNLELLDENCAPPDMQENIYPNEIDKLEPLYDYEDYHII